MINANALCHPRTQLEIEAALWRAIEYGAAIAVSASNREIVSVIYDRHKIPAFSFWRDGQDVTAEFLKVLRAAL